jgi:hypothetical protein
MPDRAFILKARFENESNAARVIPGVGGLTPKVLFFDKF